MRLVVKTVWPRGGDTSSEVDVAPLDTVGSLRERVGHLFKVDAARVRLRRPGGAVLADDDATLAGCGATDGPHVTAWVVASTAVGACVAAAADAVVAVADVASAVAVSAGGAGADVDAVAAEPDGASFEVSVRVDDGRTFSLRVRATDTGGDVAYQVKRLMGVRWRMELDLWFAGRAVFERDTMQKIGVRSGSALRAERPLRGD